MLIYVGHCTDTSVHVHNHTSFPIKAESARSALRRRRRVSAPRRSRSFWAAFFLAPVFSIDRPPRRSLPRPNCHSHSFTSFTLLPSLPSTAAVSQLSKKHWEARPLTSCACYTGEDLPARIKGISGTLPTMLRQLVKICMYLAYTCTYSVYTCTYTVHQYHVLYAYTTTVVATAYSPVVPCTAFDIGI